MSIILQKYSLTKTRTSGSDVSAVFIRSPGDGSSQPCPHYPSAIDWTLRRRSRNQKRFHGFPSSRAMGTWRRQCPHTGSLPGQNPSCPFRFNHLRCARIGLSSALLTFRNKQGCGYQQYEIQLSTADLYPVCFCVADCFNGPRSSI